ncbi:unnamed protein product [Closterium sp. NIES-53]
MLPHTLLLLRCALLSNAAQAEPPPATTVAAAARATDAAGRGAGWECWKSRRLAPPSRPAATAAAAAARATAAVGEGAAGSTGGAASAGGAGPTTDQAAALGSSESAVAPGAGESAATLGSRESGDALDASASTATGLASAEALHTFTLDSGASRSFFRDCTTVPPLAAPVPVSLADPTGGPVVAQASTVLPCPAVPSGSLSSLHLPEFSTNFGCVESGVCVWSACSELLVSGTLSPESPLAPPPRSPLAATSPQHALPSPSRRSSLLRVSSDHCSSADSPQDVWGSAPVGGTNQERYFLLVVDEYTRYTTNFPLRRKADISGVLIPWIRAIRRQLCEWFLWDFPVLHLHSDKGSEFSSGLLAEFYQDEGIRQSFTLPASPQQNGIAERRIGLIREVAPHQLNLWPRVSEPKTSPALRWTGKVGVASVFRVWGALSLVRDAKASKLSSRTLRCVFLGLPTDAPPWQFYHPRERRVFSSQNVTFDESVCFYRLHPHASHPVPLASLFLVPVPPSVDALPPQGPSPPGLSHVDPPPLVKPLEICSDSSGPAEGGDPAAYDTAATRRSPRLETPPGFPPWPSSQPPQLAAVDSGAETAGAEPGGAETEGEGSGGAAARGAGSGGVATGGADSGGAASPSGGGAVGDPAGGLGAGQPLQPDLLKMLSPQAICAWIVRRGSPGGGGYGPAGVGAASPEGIADAGGTGGTAGGAGGAAGAGGSGGAGAAGPGGARTGGAGAAGAGGAVSAGGAGGTGAAGTGGDGAIGAGAAGAAGPGGARTRGIGAGGAGGATGAAGTGGAGAAGTGGAGAAGTGGACTRGAGADGAGGAAGAGRAGGATGAAGSGGAGGTAGGRGAGAAGAHGAAGAGGAIGAVGAGGVGVAGAGGAGAAGTAPRDSTRASTPVRACRVSRPRPPAVPRTHGMTLPRSQLDYVACLVTESKSVCAPSVGCELALSSDVLDDRQFELECLAAALPRFASMLLCPEGDPDALDIPTPRCYAEAITGEYFSQWQATMDAETASWKSTGTYVDEVPPHGANIVDGMWIFRVKRPPGSPPSFKARYVARGFSHRQGVNFFHTFSPTPKMTTLQSLLHVAAQRHYELHSLDFSTAFLQGSLHEEILRRPVYGLRQVPREWHDTPRTALAALGFAPSSADPSLFQRTDTTLPSFYVLVYVEDLVFATADTEALALVKAELQERHTCTDLGELRSYLGLQITRDRARRTITLTQSHMVHQVLQRFGFQFSSPQPTPLSTGHSLSAPRSNESVEPSGPYLELVGCLMYLMTCTRPDLAYPLSLLARYVAPGRHRKVHWDAAKRVLCYLCSTSGMGLVLGGRGSVVLTRHSDASWADDHATQRSKRGHAFSLGSGSVLWRSTLSSSMLGSSCEAEIHAGAMAAQELRWLTYNSACELALWLLACAQIVWCP